jgi:hypothetical protein
MAKRLVNGLNSSVQDGTAAPLARPTQTGVRRDQQHAERLHPGS